MTPLTLAAIAAERSKSIFSSLSSDCKSLASETVYSSEVPPSVVVASNNENNDFDNTLTFTKLSELEAYIDEYAEIRGWRWRVARIHSKAIDSVQYEVHIDNLTSSYGNRDRGKRSTNVNVNNVDKSQRNSNSSEKMRQFDDGSLVDETESRIGADAVMTSSDLLRPPKTSSVVYSKTYVCHREGKVNSHTNYDERRTRSKRCDCRCQLNTSYHFSSKLWKINKYCLEHNHDLSAIPINQLNSRLITSLQQITAEQMDYLREIWRGGTRNPALRDLFMQHFQIGWIHDNVLRNIVTQLRSEVGGGTSNETAKLFEWFNSQPDSFVRFQVDADNRLQSVFCMLKQQIEFLKSYPDVLIIDATYKTNRFNHQLVLITVVDDEYNSQVVAAALVQTEDINYYSWIFRQIKEVAGAEIVQRIKCVMTDGCTSFPAALRAELPAAKHLLCLWHITQNVSKQAARLFPAKQTEILEKFAKSAYSESFTELASSWTELLSLCSPVPQLKEYFNILYESSPQWAVAFTATFPNLNIATSQRNESMNHVMKNKIDRGTSLLQLFQNIKDALNTQYQRRLQRLMRLKNTQPNTRGNPNSSLKTLQQLVSNFAAQKVESEILSSAEYCVLTVNLNIEEPSQTFSDLSRPPRTYTVGYIEDTTKQRICIVPTDDLATCTCNWATMFSLPCRHILAVNRDSLRIAPVQLHQLGHRWRLSNRILASRESQDNPLYNNWVPASIIASSLLTTPNDVPRDRWASILSGAANRLIEISIKRKATFSRVHDAFHRLTEEIMQLSSPMLPDTTDESKYEGKNEPSPSEFKTNSSNTFTVPFNPLHATNINSNRKRQSPAADPSQIQSKKYRCSNCSQTGHNRTNCRIRNNLEPSQTSSDLLIPSSSQIAFE